MKSRRGSILVVVLFMLTMLSYLALSLTYRAGSSIRVQRQEAIMIHLRAQADSAVAVAIGRLAENVNDFDHFAELWHTHAPLANESWIADWSPPPGEDASEFVADYAVIDEEGKLHLLMASSYALEILGLTSQQIASLFDWMDDDAMPRSEGAENEYYLAKTNPYRAKNAPLQVLDELLLIRGFSRRDYLGEDFNHNRQLDANENDGDVNLPADNADGQLKLGCVDLLTTVGDGRININTAPRPVLMTLPISEQAVDQIIAYRTFDSGSSGTLQDHVFRSASDILQLQGLSDGEKAILPTLVCFKSSYFRIFAWAKHLNSGLRVDVQALVKMDSEHGPQVLQWKAGAL